MACDIRAPCWFPITQNCIRRTSFSLSEEKKQAHIWSLHSRIAFAIVCSKGPRVQAATTHSSLLIKIIWVNLLAAICTLFTATPSNLFSFFAVFLFGSQFSLAAVCVQQGCRQRLTTLTHAPLCSKIISFFVISVRSTAVTPRNTYLQRKTRFQLKYLLRRDRKKLEWHLKRSCR